MMIRYAMNAKITMNDQKKSQNESHMNGCSLTDGRAVLAQASVKHSTLERSGSKGPGCQPASRPSATRRPVHRGNHRPQ